MTRVAIFVSGGGSNMVKLVQSMVGDHPARPAVVVSNVPDAGGLTRAREMSVPVLAVDHRPFGKDRAAFEAALTQELTPFAPDLICLAGFMRVLTAGFVTPWRGKMLNIHPSLLPKFRGLDTHARAIAANETEHGCSVHEVTPELDDGPLLGQARLTIAASETAEALAARVLTLEHQLYPAVLRRFVQGDKSVLHLPI